MSAPPPPQPGGLNAAHRPAPPRFRNLAASGHLYQPPDGLEEAVEAALALGAPLLLTGEPGTGKTQVAFWLAWRYGVPVEPPPRADGGFQGGLYRLDVRSTTTAEDLTAGFDTVAYFHAAHDPQAKAGGIDRGQFVMPGPLYKAFKADGPSIILIDEVDKASRDFPNDLLNALDQHEFVVRETQERVRKPADQPAPLVVITSNTERRLPAPFLRRCVYHHIVFSQRTIEQAEDAHLGHLDPHSTQGADGQPVASERARSIARTARQKFSALRDELEVKPPSTGEYLAWLSMLLRDPRAVDALRDAEVSRLPLMSLLVKTHEDRELLGLDAPG